MKQSVELSEELLLKAGGWREMKARFGVGTLMKVFNKASSSKSGNFVEIACGIGRIIGRKADGTVLSGDEDDKAPKDLSPAIAIRAGGQVYAAQMTDGSWKAWGNRDAELAKKIESLGPVKDIAFHSSGTGARMLLWID